MGVKLGRISFFVFITVMVFGCIADIIQQRRQSLNQQRRQSLNQQRRQSFVDVNPHLKENVKQAILEGKIFLGMTKKQAVASWGNPNSINRSGGSFGIHEQWVYERNKYIGGTVISVPSFYLYIENGVLKSWQDVD